MPDSLTHKQRSFCMSRVKSKGTSLEKLVWVELRRKGLVFKRNYKLLSGKPDVVFVNEKVAVFLDGDFWHGFRVQVWEHTLSQYWKDKIFANRKRDRKNFAKLRRAGWKVIRIWGHQIENDLQGIIARIVAAVKPRTVRTRNKH